jgi:hypothetical protein
MSTTYRVKRPEPLAVNDIKVVFQGTLNDLNTITEVEGDDSCDDDDQHDDRVRRAGDDWPHESRSAPSPQGRAEQRKPLVSISERAANSNTLL